MRGILANAGGRHASAVASGIYFPKMSAADFGATRKVVRLER